MSVQVLNQAAERLSESLLSMSESELLEGEVWAQGIDVLLREDARFRATKWGRYVLANHFVANEFVFKRLSEDSPGPCVLKESIAELEDAIGRKCILCGGDDRLVMQGNYCTLSSKYLSGQPIVEEGVGELEKYTTHLPLHTLRAAAASVPAGEWGPEAQEERVETLGWIEVSIPGRSLNERMFVARIEGQSMDDGKSGLRAGSYAVFEFWPRGTRQNRIVLVRGSFGDPETGGYAVKKYVADQRDHEGEHRQIALVSLNPDKTRFPDIVLAPESDNDLTIVASCITALSKEQIRRRPKRGLTRGRRDLSSAEGQERIATRLRKAASRLFEAEADIAIGDNTEEGVQSSARFVCLDCEAGALHVETTPLPQLPSFAKKLKLQTGARDVVVLASNLRNRSWRTPADPSCNEYRWTAPGFEDELDDELEAWLLSGLADDSATAFRVDAAGVGRVVGGRLSLSQAYRILIPPSLAESDVFSGDVTPVGNGWRLWEVVLPAVLTTSLRRQLEAFGLEIGKSAPSVRWVVTAPTAYEESPRGETYPRFDTHAAPTLHIDGVSTHFDGELTVFLLAKDELLSMRLPAGNSWILQLDKLDAGLYLLEVTHRRTRFEAIQMPFVVSDGVVPSVSARVDIEIGNEQILLDGEGRGAIERDFTELNGEADPIHVDGPPLWPVRQLWRRESTQSYGASNLSQSGELDVEELAARTVEARQRNPLGDLILDFEELGRVELRHTRRTDADSLHQSLKEMVDQKSANAEGLNGQFPLLRNLWLNPLLERLGFQVREIDQLVLESAPSSSTAILLYENTREGDGIACRLRVPLVITSAAANWDSAEETSVRGFADKLCSHFSTSEAYVTDGLRWTRHKKRSTIHATVWDLREITQPDQQAAFEHFLFDFVAGV